MQRPTAKLFGSLLAALVIANPADAQSPASSKTAGPFVDISIDGSDVILRPERLRYRVTADPGSYVSVFLISAGGRVSLLNPYEGALAGSRRRELLREASPGFSPGESYLVAVATRNGTHSAQLVRHVKRESRLASDYSSADASLDELLTRTLPGAGDDFSFSYTSFRLLSNDFPMMLAYSQGCSSAGFFFSDPFLSQGLYGRTFSLTPLYGGFRDGSRYLGYSEFWSREAACRGPTLQQPLLLGSGPLPTPPAQPGDTSAESADGIPKLFPPLEPRTPIPFDPDPRNATPGVESGGRALPSARIDPIALPSVPVEAGRPVAQPIDAPSPRNDAPRVDPIPVQIERRAPITEPTVQWQRPDPVVQPVAQPTPQPVSQPTPQPVSPPPPPPSPSPQPVPDIPPPGG